jgi:glucose/arabinose dehydrogenase
MPSIDSVLGAAGTAAASRVIGRGPEGRLSAHTRDAAIDPELIWVPSIATSGLMVYTGDRFPQWRATGSRAR